MKYDHPVFKRNQPDDSYKYLALPAPVGAYPYHLDLSVLTGTVDPNRLVFHMCGDTGSSRRGPFQKKVTAAMKAQLTNLNAYDRPKFFYHLGDLVYHFGEEKEYAAQFFEPYENYEAPIVAIPGNHDSDINLVARPPYSSLSAFSKVFCTSQPAPVPFSGGSLRMSTIQPNSYWTLDTPLATFIGLNSNVPKFGIVEENQRAWLYAELRAAAEQTQKALFICVHHAPYSADTNHGSSLPIIELLELAFKETGIYADAVFSGHVHNYQRMSRRYDTGREVLFLVAGAGGFDDLHPIADRDDPSYEEARPWSEHVSLEAYADQSHGFLKLCLSRHQDGILLEGEYFTVGSSMDSADDVPVLADSFSKYCHKS